MKKPSRNTYPINELVKNRWSPRAFSEKLVDIKKIASLLEAARWAPSAFNEQPWRFIVGMKGDKTYDKILQSLVEWNQQWAGKAPVLILNIASEYFSHNNKPNATAQYDLGQAVALMLTEAVSQGLISHEMSGFDAEKANELLAIPEGFQAISVTAIGYYGDPNILPADMLKSEKEERKRRSLKELVFSGDFGESMHI